MQINNADELLLDEVSLWWEEWNCLGRKSKQLTVDFRLSDVLSGEV